MAHYAWHRFVGQGHNDGSDFVLAHHFGQILFDCRDLVVQRQHGVGSACLFKGVLFFKEFLLRFFQDLDVVGVGHFLAFAAFFDIEEHKFVYERVKSRDGIFVVRLHCLDFCFFEIVDIHKITSGKL